MTPDLTNLISQAVAQTMTPEFVQKEVNTRVEKLITESINNALRNYSDTGKLIEKAVQEALKVDRLDIPTYGLMVADMLKVQIEATVAPLIAGRLAADMDELLKMAPKEVKLSSIVTEMVNLRKEDGAYGQNIVACFVEHNEYGATSVYLDKDGDMAPRDKYQFDYQLHIDKDGKIYRAVLDQTEYKSTGATKRHVYGRAYGLEQKLRAMIACSTKFIVDEDEVDTGYEH